MLKVMNSVAVLLPKTRGWSVGREANDRGSFSLIKSRNKLQNLLNSCEVSKNSSGLLSGRYENKLIIKNGVFWDVTPCGSCKNLRFGGTWRLLHQGDKNQ
jgi:hypothetical protein